jgi:hypothetical protein
MTEINAADSDVRRIADAIGFHIKWFEEIISEVEEDAKSSDKE